MKTFAEQMEGVRQATLQVILSIRDQFTPTIQQLRFELQRIFVDSLLAEPWYRRLRSRWRLRRAPVWADIYPAKPDNGGAG